MPGEDAMPWWGWALVGWLALSLVLGPLIGLALSGETER